MFEPGLLQGMDAGFDDSEIAADGQLAAIPMGISRRCAALKFSARIVGMATAVAAAGDLDDASVVQQMDSTFQRLIGIRQAYLRVLGIPRDHESFPAIWNSVTNSAVDAVAEEWKWSKILPTAKPLPLNLIATLLNQVVVDGEPYDVSTKPFPELDLMRKLCAFEAIPKIYALKNYFDYFQSSQDILVSRLLSQVVEQAEHYFEKLCEMVAFNKSVQAFVVQRMYSSSLEMMCEVYKAKASADVQALREMPTLDRSTAMNHYEVIGGMKYDHILQAHEVAMEKWFDTGMMIFDSMQRR